MKLSILALALLSVAATAQTYTVTDLGTLKGDNESSAFWINNSGEVVGCSDTATVNNYPCTGLVPGQHAFQWTASGGLKDLGTLSGATVSGALGVNDDGTVVGYSNFINHPATDFYAVMWHPSGAIVNLGTLSGGASSAAFQINSSSEIAGDSFLSTGLVDAASWTGSTIKSLGSLPKAIFTAGLGINDSGYVVGESVFSYGPPFTSHGFFWTGSKMEDLGTLSGGITSMANAINTSGVIVGQSDGTQTAGLWHAVLWNSSHKIQDLGTLPGGNFSTAFAINDSEVVVGYGNALNASAHAMIWTSSDGMIDLNDLVPSNSGWVLVNANSINNLGQIVGYGMKGGKKHAFLLTPAS